MKAGFHLHQSLSDAQTFALQVVNAGGTAKVDTDYSRGGLPHAVAYTLPATHCTCGDAGYCPIHVPCDDDCGALLTPTTPEELTKALEHWRHHQWLSRCAHGY